METEDDLIKTYIGKGILYGDEIIVLKGFCKEFIESSKARGLAIIGIDGFYVYKDRTVKPNLDEIADFSEIQVDGWPEYLEKCTSAALKFIDHMLDYGKSDGYCFTLMDYEEAR